MPRQFNEERTIFSATTKIGDNWISTCERMKQSLHVTLYENSLKIIDLNRRDTTNLLEENMGVKFYDFGVGSSFLNMIPKEQATQEKI